ncbi:hypothetical protein FOA43_002829 [Brettanomyces nanus]|uniref:phosphoinositide 5-phosphatase n=1 Tax=Eeniella nana TaxID=13502 RepID=A0A875S8Q7_EENNA|nr:uncharacterized protein FOA43_002829 [Brettanomyces nanus]QPG75474.1 hypothetical protein FOA43_002829 [Brettanomyces nanus]
MQVFINRWTRCIIIVSNDFALVLRDSRSEEELSKLKKQRKKDHLPESDPKLLIEFICGSTLPDLEALHFIEIHVGHYTPSPTGTSSINSGLGDVPSLYRPFPLHERNFYGFLGLYFAKGSIYVGFVTEKTEVGSAIVGNKIYRIDNTMFISLTTGECFDYYAEDNSQNQEATVSSSKIRSVEKLLASGTFYYSPHYDMSSFMQERGESSSGYTFDSSLYEYNNRFVWNGNMIQGLVAFRSRLSYSEKKAFDKGKFLLTVIRGFAQSLTINNLSEPANPFLMTVTSKQDCKKSGPLFGPYGLDDNGNATNFVETEFIISNKDHKFAFLLLRGNVPLFWKLEAQLLRTKVEFPRSDDASKHAFTRHFDNLVAKYGAIHVVDALSTKGSQPEISKKYHEALKASIMGNEPVLYSKVDASQCSRKKNTDAYAWEMMSHLEESIKSNQAYCSLSEDYMLHEIVCMRQLGTFLVNTLDSNDRANFIEMKISEQIVTMIFKTFGMEERVSWDDFWHNHTFLWDANGRSLGKLADSYNNSIRTKNKSGGIMGKMANQSKKYVSSSSSSSSSSGKQAQFDKLLGRLEKQFQVQLVDPIHDYVLTELEKRSNEFSSMKQLKIFTVTFNVNGEQFPGDITRLIFPEPERYNRYDIVVIGLEEVVELTPGKIMNIDPKIRLFWEKKLKSTLIQFNNDNYVLLRGEQLGGLLSLIFVREADNLQYIKEIETASKKTGLKGMAANKGGVAISFNYSKTTKFCFVVSHLAAGYSNTEERHQDFKTIANGLRFRQNRMLRDFDVVIWMGDFNFRIDASNDSVRKALKDASMLSAESADKQKIFNMLFEHDQLNNQMATGQSFPFFDEKEISFMPTYKYDKDTSVYDSSEKQRVPAWTDRIVTLTRDKRLLQQELYNSIQSFQFSDHKPVYGVFSADFDIVDEALRSKIEQRLYEVRKAEVGGVNSIISNDLMQNKGGVLRYGLPAPSNSGSTWWLDKEVKFAQLESGEYEVNSRMPKNPFIGTTEKEFVKIVKPKAGN